MVHQVDRTDRRCPVLRCRTSTPAFTGRRGARARPSPSSASMPPTRSRSRRSASVCSASMHIKATRCTASSRTAGPHRTSFRPMPRRSTTRAAELRRAQAGLGTAHQLLRRPGHSPTGASVEIHHHSLPYSEFTADAKLMVVSIYQANARGVLVPLTERSAASAVHGHGKRVARDAGDPSDARHRITAGGQSPSRVRRALRQARRRQGADRGDDGDGVDRSPTSRASRTSARAQTPTIREERRLEPEASAFRLGRLLGRALGEASP